jgi:hypothetical protein
MAEATDIVRHNSPGPTDQDYWWSVAFKHPMYLGRTCDVLGDGEQYEWYVNLLLQDVDGALEIVAEASHLAWMDLEDFLRRGDHAGQGRQALGRPVHRSILYTPGIDGFLCESFPSMH